MTVQALFTAGDMSAGSGLVQNVKMPYGAETATDSFESIMSGKMDSKKSEINTETEKVENKVQPKEADAEVSESQQPEKLEENIDEPVEELEEETGEKKVEDIFEEVVEEAVQELEEELTATVGEIESTDSQDAEEKENLLSAFEALATLQNEIMKMFNISAEELNKACEELGISSLEMLDASNLQKLIMQLNNTSDVTEFLTNENMATQFKALKEVLEGTLEENDVDVEALMKTLEEIPEAELQDMTKPTETVKEDVQIEVENVVAEETTTVVQKNVMDNNEQSGTELNESNTKEARTERISSSDNETARGIEGFIQKLGEVYAENNADAISPEGYNRLTEIAARVIEQIQVSMGPDQTSLEVQLYPEHLGRVAITVASREGVMTASITTQTETAKEAIESQLAVLRETFENQGLKVEAIEVTVSQFEFERDGSQGAREEQRKEQKRVFRADAGANDFEAEVEQQILPTVEGSGENINYRA